MQICVVDACLRKVLSGIDRVLFEYVPDHWESLFTEEAASDKSEGLATKLCPSIEYVGGRSAIFHVRVSRRTRMVRADGTTMSVDDLDATGITRCSMCIVELAVTNVIGDRVAVNLHADTIYFL